MHLFGPFNQWSSRLVPLVQRQRIQHFVLKGRVFVIINSLFKSSRRPTLYVVHFTVSRRLFYRPKIGRLLCFGEKVAQNAPNTSFTTTPQPALHTALPAPVHQHHGNGTAVFLQATTGECCLLFVRGHLLYTLLKRLN